MISICSRFPGNSALLPFDVRDFWWEKIFPVRYNEIEGDNEGACKWAKNPAIELLASH